MPFELKQACGIRLHEAGHAIDEGSELNMAMWAREGGF